MLKGSEKGCTDYSIAICKFALFGAPVHIDNVHSQTGFLLEYASKTPLVLVADFTRLNAAFPTPKSNNAPLEHSLQTALLSKCFDSHLQLLI